MELLSLNVNVFPFTDFGVKGNSNFSELPSSTLKERNWETINSNIVKDICKVTDSANGSHSSGKDNRFGKWNISNKTAKIFNGNNVKISSYRLTGSCGNKDHGKIKTIVGEIEKRDNSFDYYSILLRKEYNETIVYSWYIVPKNFHIFDPRKQFLKLKYGKQKTTKNKVIGWEGQHCEIIFSMSSQLWFNFSLDDIKHFEIHSVTIENKHKMTYSDIYKLTEQYRL